MGLEIRDGFQFLVTNKDRLLCIESRQLDACLKRLAKEKSLGAALSFPHGFAEDSLACLKDLPWLKAVYIRGLWPKAGYSDIYALRSLRTIELGDKGFTPPIDLSRFPTLEAARLVWTAGLHKSLVRCPHLRQLAVRSYSPQSRDLRPLSSLGGLVSLTLHLPRIDALAGIGSFHRLQYLDIQMARSLKDARELVLLRENLHTLRMDYCPALTGVDRTVERLTSLTNLALCDDPALANIRFIGSLPELEFFAFVNTRVIDGDLSPCLRLRYAGFDNKRHYSHTMPQVTAHIKAQGRDDDEGWRRWVPPG